MGILADVPLLQHTYYVHLEAITCFLMLLSVPMQSLQRADHSSIFRLVTQGRHSMHAPLLVKSLLENFIEQRKAPFPYGADFNNYGLVFGMAYTLYIQNYEANMVDWAELLQCRLFHTMQFIPTTYCCKKLYTF